MGRRDGSYAWAGREGAGKLWKVYLIVVLGLLLGTCCQMPESPVGPVAAVGTFEMASAESVPAICADPAMAAKIRGIMLEAMDEALREHVKHMFEVWMRDPRDQPDRAATGIRAGVRAYISASKKAAEWSPLECPG